MILYAGLLLNYQVNSNLPMDATEQGPLFTSGYHQQAGPKMTLNRLWMSSLSLLKSL